MSKRLSQRRFVTAFLVVSTGAVAGCGVFDTAGRYNEFTPRVYVGAGVLASQVEPDTDGVPGTSVDESMSGGASLTLGYDINSRFSVEGHVADLGEATLDPAGSIGYRVGGISGVLYGLNDEPERSRRTGFSVFGKLGIGMMSNDAEVVEFNRVNDVHLLAGLGLEYGLNNGLGFRAELVAHETDAKFAQLGLVYRFGESSGRGPERSVTNEADAIASEDVAAPVEEAASTESAAVIAVPIPVPEEAVVINVDEDEDGVLAGVDQCLETPSGVPVDAVGCAVFGGAIEGITFEVDSDKFTPGALVALDGVAGTLMKYPEIRVTVEAHTDNIGSAAANLQLSKRRALAVARYLVDKGISGARLKPQAFGESKPRTSNLTSQGRAANRRVEFSIQK